MRMGDLWLKCAKVFQLWSDCKYCSNCPESSRNLQKMFAHFTFSFNIIQLIYNSKIINNSKHENKLGQLFNKKNNMKIMFTKLNNLHSVAYGSHVSTAFGREQLTLFVLNDVGVSPDHQQTLEAILLPARTRLSSHSINSQSCWHFSHFNFFFFLNFFLSNFVLVKCTADFNKGVSFWGRRETQK